MIPTQPISTKIKHYYAETERISSSLGTATYLTDHKGYAYQFFLNLPFGESMAEQRMGSYENQYKFTGQEFDPEIEERDSPSPLISITNWRQTGFYYYGARYYHPGISVFLAFDPAFESTWDAYGYVYNNPVRYVDPSGMFAVDYPAFDGIDQYHDDDGWFFWDRQKQSYLHLKADENGNYQNSGYYNSSGGLDQISGEYTIIHNGRGWNINTDLPNLNVDSGGNFTYSGSSSDLSASVNGKGWGFKGPFVPGGRKGVGVEAAGLRSNVSYSVSGSFFSDELNIRFVNTAYPINKAVTKFMSNFTINDVFNNVIDSDFIRHDFLGQPSRFDFPVLSRASRNAQVLGSVFSSNIPKNSVLRTSVGMDNASPIGNAMMGGEYEIPIVSPFLHK